MQAGRETDIGAGGLLACVVGLTADLQEPVFVGRA